VSTSSQISEREREILRLIATGATNQQIANTLAISINTVKVHIRNIFAKIGVASRAEAAMYAVRAGLVALVEIPVVSSVDAAGQLPTVAAEPMDADLLGESPVAEPAPGTHSGVAPAVTARSGLVKNAVRLVGDSGNRALLVLLVVTVVALLAAAAAIMLPRVVSTPAPTPATPIQTIPRWRELPSLPVGLAAFGLTAYSYEGRSFLYAVGGDGGSTTSDQVLRYDLSTAVWVPMSRKPTAVTDVRAAVLGGRVYVPGGRTSSGAVSNLLEVYDPQRDVWQVLTPMPGPRSGYALAAVEGKLYVIGGWDGSGFRADVWQYNPDDDAWRPRSAMPTSRAYAAVAVVDQQILVMGGEGSSGRLSANERYSPVADRGGVTPWSTQAPAPFLVSRTDAAVAGGLVMVLAADGATSRLLVYNPQTESWDSSEIPIPPLADLRVQSIGGRLYIAGGRNASGASGRVYQYQAVSSVFLPALP
jgi:DNA-binding CsgD family transcriptional regulator